MTHPTSFPPGDVTFPALCDAVKVAVDFNPRRDGAARLPSRRDGRRLMVLLVPALKGRATTACRAAASFPHLVMV